MEHNALLRIIGLLVFGAGCLLSLSFKQKDEKYQKTKIHEGETCYSSRKKNNQLLNRIAFLTKVLQYKKEII
ncbi:hypothetical protein BH11BAC5_BH11BAC5_23830 [soil metagenome]